MAVDAAAPNRELTDQVTASPQTSVPPLENPADVLLGSANAITAGLTSEPGRGPGIDDDTAELEDDNAEAAGIPAREPMSVERSALIVGLVVVVALAGLCGWLGYRAYQSHQAKEQRELFLEVGRQSAINLTRIRRRGRSMAISPSAVSRSWMWSSRRGPSRWAR
jgi:Mce-associated membrane protein